MRAGGVAHQLTLSFDDACRFLFPRLAGGDKWSLEPTRQLLETLGHPETHFAALHVGGTNGKGSVAVLAAEALRAAGWRVGLYTSPHLVDVRERIVVDGRPITHEAFAAWTERVWDPVCAVGASFFEATTAIAFADFAARGVDMAVVEVGLGGRLDATNVIDPLASAVVTVAREHTEYLGEALDGIAREKAGIGKLGRPFVIGERDPELCAVLERTAAAAGAVPIRVPPESTYQDPLAMGGPHQRRNAAIAAALLGALPDRWRPAPASMRAGFARARLPGRFDRRGRWVLDVAHNLSGIDTLLAALRAANPPRPLHALVGILRDKPWAEMLEHLLLVVDRIWVTDPPTAPAERRWDLEAVAARFAGRVVVQPSFDAALREVARDAATVLVTGSFHTVGDAMRCLPGFAPLG